MARYIKFIGFLVLALALWQTASDTFIGSESINGKKSVDIQAITGSPQQEATCFNTPQMPYLPDAELAGGHGGFTQLVTSSRI